MKPRRLLIGLLTFLLLFAQQAAYAHAAGHLGKEPPPKEQLGHAQLCGKCVSFEKLSAAAPAWAAQLDSLPCAYERPAEATRAFRPLAVVAFHSRAPPVLL
jgi:hypothetical protein